MLIAFGLLIPFAGTVLGAACVFFLKNNSEFSGRSCDIPSVKK
jgi:hypothetical protein